MLFFGCRARQADFFFAGEWLPLADRGSLKLYTAFSRDQDHKIYVQHKIEEAGAVVWEWLQLKNATVLIAG